MVLANRIDEGTQYHLVLNPIWKNALGTKVHFTTNITMTESIHDYRYQLKRVNFILANLA